MSPLPRLAANPLSPFRRVSQKHSLFISPLKSTVFPPSPNRPMSYSFLRSPAKDLKSINQMMRSNNNNINLSAEKKVSKRILQDMDEGDVVDGHHVISKKLATGTNNVLGSKIQSLFSERVPGSVSSSADQQPVIITLPTQRAP